MAWLWESWEEFEKTVNPTVVTSRGRWTHSRHMSACEAQGCLWQAVEQLEQSAGSLRELGFSDKNHPPNDSESIHTAKGLVLSAIHAGETLLLFHRRLAKHDASYGFLHQNDLIEHWDRYAGTGRIALEIQQLTTDIADFLAGYHSFQEADSHLIVRGLELPPALACDFRTARDLISLGFDEIGLLVAGRGLEGVLREIARLRKIELIDTKNRAWPAHEADFYDLIEISFHLRWKKTGQRLINAHNKALLHYLRTLRNTGAHATTATSGAGVLRPRETAVVVADTANSLWKATKTRAQIEPKQLQKSW